MINDMSQMCVEWLHYTMGRRKPVLCGSGMGEGEEAEGVSMREEEAVRGGGLVRRGRKGGEEEEEEVMRGGEEGGMLCLVSVSCLLKLYVIYIFKIIL